METTTQFKDVLAERMGDMKAVVLAGEVTKLGYYCSEANVSRWLSGDRVPRSEAIPFIARALNCTPNDLLGFTNEGAA